MTSCIDYFLMITRGTLPANGYGVFPDKKGIQFTNIKAKEQMPMGKNLLRETRESMLVSKAELARKAKVSPITITRIENGYPCRLETKRKILLALGLKLSDKNKIFSNDQ